MEWSQLSSWRPGALTDTAIDLVNIYPPPAKQEPDQSARSPMSSRVAQWTLLQIFDQSYRHIIWNIWSTQNLKLYVYVSAGRTHSCIHNTTYIQYSGHVRAYIVKNIQFSPRQETFWNLKKNANYL